MMGQAVKHGGGFYDVFSEIVRAVEDGIRYAIKRDDWLIGVFTRYRPRYQLGRAM